MIGISAILTNRAFAVRRTAMASGFTLIETLVVLAIVAMIYGLFAPTFARRVALASFDSTVQTIANDLKTLRTTAILSGQPIRFDVTADGREYSAGDQIRHLKNGIQVRIISPHNGPITYHPNGSTDVFAMSVSAGPRRVRLSSNWLTGTLQIDDGSDLKTSDLGGSAENE
ncbi:prepilin-type N-terminal cleavage/methylation domain-containing protein [Porticoccaceae bacterium]|nr:prepilin-type N-terminal cleavage/methylation domain-containing protein [Porticoccaceae bacterium]